MTLTKKNHLKKSNLKKNKKYSKNVIKTFQLIKNKNLKKSIKIDHKKKTLINPKAKYKNYILLEKFKEEEKKRLEILKIKNQPNRIYKFNLNFFYNNNYKSDTLYLRIISDLQKVCENIKNYKSNKRDIKYYYDKFSNNIINYAGDSVPDEFALPRKIGDESRINVIYKSCVDKHKNPKLRIISFQILNLLIRKTRFNLLRKQINSIKKEKISEDLLMFINITIDRYIHETIKLLGNKHLKYLFLIVF